MTHQYSRAETLLTRPFHASRTRFRPSGRETHTNMNGGMGLGEPDFALAGTRSNATANANAKGKERASGDLFPRLPVGPAAMIDVAADGLSGVSRLVDMSVACRYLCAQCLVSILRVRLLYSELKGVGSSREMA
jgi:anaphase-promoting complex subunit 6